MQVFSYDENYSDWPIFVLSFHTVFTDVTFLKNEKLVLSYMWRTFWHGTRMWFLPYVEPFMRFEAWITEALSTPWTFIQSLTCVDFLIRSKLTPFHTLSICTVSPLCGSLGDIEVWATVKLFPHSNHLYGFSLVWNFWWVVRHPLLLKCFPHSEHLDGFSPMWILWCKVQLVQEDAILSRTFKLCLHFPPLAFVWFLLFGFFDDN